MEEEKQNEFELVAPTWHKPRVQCCLDVEAFVFWADQDGLLGPEVLVRPHPLNIVLNTLAPMSQQVVVNWKTSVVTVIWIISKSTRNLWR